MTTSRAAKRGMDRMLAMMDGGRDKHPPFAPPFLKAGKLVIAQTANILFYLGPRLKLAPRDEAGRLWLHQLQLTVTDFVKEIHDTHHPIAGGLYYEDQKPEAKTLHRRIFWRSACRNISAISRRVLKKSGGPYVLGRKLSYVDLSLFQLVEGLRYAFPKAMARIERKVPGVVARARPRRRRARASRPISPHRGACRSTRWGIFRHYPELDG